ncbi:MAG: DUF6069 family protein [Chloroflexota bacterium]
MGTGVIAIGRLPRSVVLAAITAVAANLLVYFLAGALWGVPGEFVALNPVSIVVTSVGGVAIAALGLAVLARLTRKAIPIFAAAAGVVTLLSLMGPFQAMAGAMPGLPAATTATGITMLLLHILTGGIIAAALPIQARR